MVSNVSKLVSYIPSKPCVCGMCTYALKLAHIKDAHTHDFRIKLIPNQYFSTCVSQVISKCAAKVFKNISPGMSNLEVLMQPTAYFKYLETKIDKLESDSVKTFFFR